MVTPGDQLGSHPGRQVTPAGHRVGGHHPHPCRGGGHDGGQSDRARAEHHDALAGVRVGAVQGVHRDRHRLDESGGLGVKISHTEHLGSRDAQKLLEPAIAVNSHQFQRHARVGTPDAAWIAAPAAPQRPHRDPVAGPQAARAVRAGLRDDRAQLVALDPGEEGTGAGQRPHLARVHMKIRPADANDLGPKYDIFRSGRPRICHVIEDQHAGGLGHRRQHPRSHFPRQGRQMPWRVTRSIRTVC